MIIRNKTRQYKKLKDELVQLSPNGQAIEMDQDHNNKSIDIGKYNTNDAEEKKYEIDDESLTSNDSNYNNNGSLQIGNYRQHEIKSFSMNDKEIQQTSQKMTWTKCNASSFRVRDIGYFTKDKSKKQSEPSLYDVFAVDTYKVDRKVRVNKIMEASDLLNNDSNKNVMNNGKDTKTKKKIKNKMRMKLKNKEENKSKKPQSVPIKPVNANLSDGKEEENPPKISVELDIYGNEIIPDKKKKKSWKKFSKMKKKNVFKKHNKAQSDKLWNVSKERKNKENNKKKKKGKLLTVDTDTRNRTPSRSFDETKSKKKDTEEPLNENEEYKQESPNNNNKDKKANKKKRKYKFPKFKRTKQNRSLSDALKHKDKNFYTEALKSDEDIKSDDEDKMNRDKSVSPSMSPPDDPSHVRNRMTSQSMVVISSSPTKKKLLEEINQNDDEIFKKKNNKNKQVKDRKGARNKSKSNAPVMNNKNDVFVINKNKKVNININVSSPLLQHNTLPIKMDKSKIPKYLVINIMIPNTLSKNKGDGVQMVLYGKLGNVSNNASINLMNKFINCYDNRERDNFKCCARIMNLGYTNFNFVTKQLIKKSNGQKFLIPPEICLFNYDGNYFGVDIDLYNLTSSFAKKMLNYILPESKSVICDFGFLLEANNKNELPEQVAICCRISKLDINELQLLNPILNSMENNGVKKQKQINKKTKKTNKKSKKKETVKVVVKEEKKKEEEQEKERNDSDNKSQNEYINIKRNEFMIFNGIIDNKLLLFIVILMEINIILMCLYRLNVVDNDDKNIVLIIYNCLIIIIVFVKLFILFFYHYISRLFKFK